MDRADIHPDIARAIRRSRNARAAMRRRRRSAVIAASLSIAVASGTLFAVTGVTGSDVVHAATAQAKSLADLLGARSPGARTEAQLTKTKHMKALARQRMAPRHAPVSPKATMVDIAQLLAPVPVSLAASVPGLTSAPPSLGVIVGSLPGGGGSDVVPPGGGGGAPVVFPTTQPREVVPSAVPEPGTWATMLLGFAFMGWSVRRRPSKVPATNQLPG